MRHCHIQKGNIEKVQVSDKLLKPLTEVKYLNADNVSRYRCIMRIFYENNEKLNYWLYQEDVYEEMKKDSYWSEYTIEQCQQDLASLVEWKNLNTMQDTKEKVVRFCKGDKSVISDSKTHKIYRCPHCRQKIRVPRGKGKIEITCPSCRSKFIKRT